MATHPRSAPLRAAVRENADIESSADQYASRFTGPVGRWFLHVQTRLTLDALAGLPAGAKVLDVGGGHAQVAPPLLEAGYAVTVVGSDPCCGHRLEPWTSTGQCRFDVADLLDLPYEDRSFDAVICYRLLAHSINWTRLVKELCRVAAHRVVADYPAKRSVNIISRRLFDMKRSIEGVTTRRFSLYDRQEMADAFASAGFRIAAEQPQFLMPMVLYRLAGSARFARLAEWPARRVGLTRLLGSPVIVRADRQASA
ncbi:MAG TPA: class I SAM-dependent methyltransferase [Gemmatimonadales bacterium]|nr:class I SAM-dependent methyltransferase [Gemmatimonadales bacterium]